MGNCGLKIKNKKETTLVGVVFLVGDERLDLLQTNLRFGWLVPLGTVKVDGMLSYYSPFFVYNEKPLLRFGRHTHILHGEDSASRETAVNKLGCCHTGNDCRCMEVSNTEIVIVGVVETKKLSFTLGRTVYSIVGNTIPTTNVITMSEIKVVGKNGINLPPGVIQLPCDTRVLELSTNKFIDNAVPINPVRIFTFFTYTTMIATYCNNFDGGKESETTRKKSFDEFHRTNYLLKKVSTDVLFLSGKDLRAFNNVTKKMNVKGGRKGKGRNALEKTIKVSNETFPVEVVEPTSGFFRNKGACLNVRELKNCYLRSGGRGVRSRCRRNNGALRESSEASFNYKVCYCFLFDEFFGTSIFCFLGHCGECLSGKVRERGCGVRVDKLPDCSVSRFLSFETVGKLGVDLVTDEVRGCGGNELECEGAPSGLSFRGRGRWCRRFVFHRETSFKIKLLDLDICLYRIII